MESVGRKVGLWLHGAVVAVEGWLHEFNLYPDVRTDPDADPEAARPAGTGVVHTDIGKVTVPVFASEGEALKYRNDLDAAGGGTAHVAFELPADEHAIKVGDREYAPTGLAQQGSSDGAGESAGSASSPDINVQPEPQSNSGLVSSEGADKTVDERRLTDIGNDPERRVPIDHPV